MELIYCPGCASDAHYSQPACPVCGAPHAAPAAAVPQRNPFKLIALCLLYAVAIWLGAMFVTGFAFGAAEGAASGNRVPQLGQLLSAPLLLVSIGLSIVLTVRGKLPGTARPIASTR